MAAIGPGAPAAEADAVVELRRVADRLTALGPDRLERLGPDGTSPAGRVRAVLQALADRASVAEGTRRRPVPVLGAHALADQLRVLTRDALLAPDADDEVAAWLAALRRSV